MKPGDIISIGFTNRWVGLGTKFFNFITLSTSSSDGFLRHYGVFCGDNKVIHYDGNARPKQVVKTELEEFARSKKIEDIFVSGPIPGSSPSQTIERAESLLGASDYNPFAENCEHFTTYCQTGKWESGQVVDRRRAFEEHQYRLSDLKKKMRSHGDNPSFHENPFLILDTFRTIGFSLFLGFKSKENQIGQRLKQQGNIEIGQQDAKPSRQAKPTTQTFAFKVVTLEVKRSGGIMGLGQKLELSKHLHQGQADYWIEKLPDGIHLELVEVPSGSFQMGSENMPWPYRGESLLLGNAEPLRCVTVKPFFLSKYPITQAQWKVVASLSKAKVRIDLRPDPSKFKGDNHPVENLSWDDAIEFCARLSLMTGHRYRLPSEAEWEYACRAGTTTPFHFGEECTTELANCAGNGFSNKGPKKTMSVGSFPPNAFGLYDMHGNVREWCLDFWHNNYINAPCDGSEWVRNGVNRYQNDKYIKNNNNLAYEAFKRMPPQHRVVRGGSWRDSYTESRSDYRDAVSRATLNNYIGFRVVCAY